MNIYICSTMDENYLNQGPNNEMVKQCEQREIRYQREKISGLVPSNSNTTW